MAKTEFKTIAQNKKAYHDYFVEETLEAGIELCGTEVKSLRQGRCNLKDAWCSVVDGEMLLNGCHISPYEQGNIFNRDPMRVRRLLMHKREIMRLFGKVRQDGYALVPLSVYFSGSLVKVETGMQNDDYVEILSGVSEDDIVLYTGSSSDSSSGMMMGMMNMGSGNSGDRGGNRGMGGSPGGF